MGMASAAAMKTIQRFSRGCKPIIGSDLGRFYRGRNPNIGCGNLASKGAAEVAKQQQLSWKNPFAATTTTTTTTRHYSCTSSSTLNHQLLLSASLPPPLMIPPEVKWKLNGKDNENDNNYYHFYNFARKEVTSIRKIPIPGLPYDAPWIGSCHNWVIFTNPTNGSHFLVNPFHELYNDDVFNFPYYVPLPPLDNKSLTAFTNGDVYIKKLAMSAAPYDDDCKVVAIVGPSGDLAFCKPRDIDAKWTPLKGLLKDDDQSYHYNDVIYSSQDQLFYAIGGELNDHYYFDVWDLNGPRPEGTLINPSLFDPFLDGNEGRDFTKYTLEEYMFERRYLAELSGDLFLYLRWLHREVDENGVSEMENFNEEDEENDKIRRAKSTHNTFDFRVFKLDRVQNKWDHEYRSGNRTVYLGLNHSFSRSIRGQGYINYTDDAVEKMKTSQLWGGHDFGRNDRYQRLDANRECPLGNLNLKRIQPPPIWVNNLPSM